MLEPACNLLPLKKLDRTAGAYYEQRESLA